jgi:hypothetical protein
VQLAVSIRNLLVVSWEVDPERVRIDLPRGLAPALAENGGGLVSLVAFVNEHVRLGDTSAPSFAQLNVRTYVSGDRGPGAFVLSFRVTPPGMGGAAFGAPYRPARIRVREGSVSARGLGVSLGYRRTGEPAEPGFRTGPDATHELGYFEAAGGSTRSTIRSPGSAQSSRASSGSTLSSRSASTSASPSRPCMRTALRLASGSRPRR